MKRVQLNALNSSIIALINDKVDINGSLCGLPLKFEVRKKSHTILKKIAESIEASDKAFQEMNIEVLKKYGISENTSEISKVEHPEAYKALELLHKQLMEEDINVDLEEFMFTDDDFKTSNGKSLDIGSNISPILEYLYKTT